MPIVENGLGRLGSAIIIPLVWALCGMAAFGVLMWVVYIVQKLFAQLYKIRYLKALKDVVLMGGAGAFFGAVVAATFRSLFNTWMASFFNTASIETLMGTGAVIGCLPGIIIGFYWVSQKWNHCYLCENRYAAYKGEEVDER